MKPGHPEICLFQPEIPQNTGNIARLVAGTNARLHLIRPFGFSTSDKNLRRPGLDYWPYLDLEVHDAIEPLLERVDYQVAFFSKFSHKPYTEVPTSTRLFVFGRETSGLPQEIREKYRDMVYGIPMFHASVRSLNLANAAAIVLYDQLHRRGLFNSAVRRVDE